MVRIEHCLTHQLDGKLYVFLVIHRFELRKEPDPILQLPLYTGTGDWELIGLHSLDSKPLYMVDFSSEPAFVQKPYATFLYCPWSVDFM
jgi:hypothetical protein